MEAYNNVAGRVVELQKENKADFQANQFAGIAHQQLIHMNETTRV